MSASVSSEGVDGFALFQNDPNPVSRTTSIAFKLSISGHASLRVYDLGGNLLDTLVDEELSAGIWSFDWVRGTLGPGVYLYKLSSQGESITKEMLIE